MSVEDTTINNPIQLPTNFERIQPQNLLQTLEFDRWHTIATDDFVNSLLRSQWYTISGNRMLLELRDLSIFQKLITGRLLTSDFDDTLAQTSEQHQARLARCAISPQLLQKGIHITTEMAKQLYGYSKIIDPATPEPRYTPQVDLRLMSFLAQQLEDGQTPNPTLQRISNNHQEIIEHLPPFHPDIISTLIKDPTKHHLYEEFITRFLNSAKPEDLKAIITRGYIGGPLSQVYKLHTSDLMDRGFQLALYTLDLKTTAFKVLQKLFPQVHEIDHYEDSPEEIQALLEESITNLNIFRVENGKRANTKVKATPVDETGPYKIYRAA